MAEKLEDRVMFLLKRNCLKRGYLDVRSIVIDNLVSIFKQIRFGCFFIFIFADFFRVSAREISFFTFNAGLMKIYGHDLVPCVDERESEQPKLVFDQLNSAKSKHSAVIAVFQEVGTLGGFEKIL